MHIISKGNWAKFAASVACASYAMRCMTTPEQWRVIHAIDLIFHEAGHTIFSLFGWTMMVLGGSLFQIIVPMALVAYFVRDGKLFSASVMTYWAAISTANVAAYAGDALVMKLPLITGDPDTHDWNTLLWRYGLLRHTDLIADCIFGMAVALLVAGLGLAVWGLVRKEENVLP